MQSPGAATIYSRLVTAALVLAGVIAAGASAYWQIGEGRWSFFDCFYMTVITLSTVGFGETLDGMNTLREARWVTLGLIVLGSGTLVYFVSNLTALIVEGDLQGILRRRRMDREIEKLEDHVIVCGGGTSGKHIVAELFVMKQPFVLIEQAEPRVQEISEELGTEILHVIGDATDDHVLERAGIARAKGVIATLHEDRDNLFVTITARALNAKARIVAKAVEASTEPKLRRAGANAVVSPNFIGGMRLVSEMIRPATVAFLDRMLRDRDGNQLRIEEVKIPETSHLIGKRLADTKIRNSGALVIAIHEPNDSYVYNPRSEHVLAAGAALIVLASAPDVRQLKDAMTRDAL